MYICDLADKEYYNIIITKGNLSTSPYYGIDTQQKIIYLYNTTTNKQKENLLYNVDLQYRGMYNV